MPDLNSNNDVTEPGDQDSECENTQLDSNEPPIAFGNDGSGLSGFSEVGSGDESERHPDKDYIPPSLDSVPDFEPLFSEFDSHEAQPRIPQDLDRTSPIAFFQLFVPSEAFDTFATNTNAYANSKGANMKTGRNKKRDWKATKTPELMIWFGLIIFMGLLKMSSVPLYWRSKKESQCEFTPMRNMGLTRFQQITRYFHLSPPNSGNLDEPWYAKIEPFGSVLRESARKYLVPPTQMAIDEMMVRFTGRSSHTVKMPNKPIKQGYKLFALCYYGGFGEAGSKRAKVHNRGRTRRGEVNEVNYSRNTKRNRSKVRGVNPGAPENYGGPKVSY